MDISQIFLIIALFAVIVGIYKWKYNNWRQDFPLTLQEYVTFYPNSQTDDGIKCSLCGSESLKDWGVTGPDCKKRAISCNHCSSNLYRVDK